mgnify:CR=1 FL=1
MESVLQTPNPHTGAHMTYQVGDLVSHSKMGGIAIITGIAVGGEDPVYRTKWFVAPINNYEPISVPQRYLTPTQGYP